MSRWIRQRKNQAMVLLLSGSLGVLFTFQNFKFPQTIQKTTVDLTSALNSSDGEIQRTRHHLARENQLSSLAPTARSATPVPLAPMKLHLKRAPAKVSPQKKKTKLKRKRKRKRSQRRDGPVDRDPH